MKIPDAGHGDSPLIPTPEGWTEMARRPGSLDHTTSFRPVWAAVFPNHSRLQFWESSWDCEPSSCPVWIRNQHILGWKYFLLGDRCEECRGPGYIIGNIKMDVSLVALLSPSNQDWSQEETTAPTLLLFKCDTWDLELLHFCLFVFFFLFMTNPPSPLGYHLQKME